MWLCDLNLSHISKKYLQVNIEGGLFGMEDCLSRSIVGERRLRTLSIPSAIRGQRVPEESQGVMSQEGREGG